jgi:hypothetical protein
MDCVVLAVNRQQRLALASSFGCDQFSRGDHTLFVCQADRFSGAHRLIRRLKARYSDDCAYNEIYVRMCGNPHGAGRAINYLYVAHARRFESRSQNLGIGFGSNGNQARIPSPALVKRAIEIPTGG